MTEKDIKDRFVGTLLGLAVGDALGAPVEFMSAQEIVKTHGTLKEMVGGGWLKSKPGEYTDDTTMMLCIAESLVENEDCYPSDVAQRFVQWLRSNPKDIGKTTREALKRIASGIPWQEAGDKERPSNGSVMRCAPIGLVYAFNTPELVKVSIETSAITHAHEDATWSCVLINLFISALVQGLEKKSAFATAVEILEGYNKHFMERFIFHSPSFDPADGLAVTTTRFAVSSFLWTKTFEEAVVTAVNLGGDTDTVGAVAGALAGAHWGASVIPKRWSSKLNPYSAQQIRKMGRMLFKLASNPK